MSIGKGSWRAFNLTLRQDVGIQMISQAIAQAAKPLVGNLQLATRSKRDKVHHSDAKSFPSP
jgi:hypothetical protein